ncbi:MAG: helix-turn-helix domain-containing protein [bacterium]
MHEEELRQQAVHRYFSGEKVADILNDLNRSRQWLYKWVARYQTGVDNWYTSDSRAPKRVANRTPENIEALVIKARNDLLKTKYAQIGANAIRWRLHNLGLSEDELPEVWTINRILKRHGLQTKRERYEPKGTPYPKLKAPFPNDLHQADMVGPRYLKGGVCQQRLKIDPFWHSKFDPQGILKVPMDC